MYRHPFEIEIDARYAQERVATMMETTRPLPRLSTARRAAGPPPAVAWALRGVGRRLIAAGERLAGPATRNPMPAGPAA